MLSQEIADTILVLSADKAELKLLKRDIEHINYQCITCLSFQEALPYLSSGQVGIVICSQHQTEPDGGVEILREIEAQFPEIERILLLREGERNPSIEELIDTPLCSIISQPWELAGLRYIIKTLSLRRELDRENEILNRRLVEQSADLNEQKEISEEKMALAGQVHKKMLMSRIPEGINGLTIETFILPPVTVAGAFFDFFVPAENKLGFLIGDIHSKGTLSLLLAAAIKAQFRRFVVPTLRVQMTARGRAWGEDLLPPGEVLQRIHGEVGEYLTEFGYIATLFYCVFDLRKRVFTYICCGAPKPIYYDSRSDVFVHLCCDNPPLGASNYTAYKRTDINFHPGDRFIFYSDELIKATNNSGEEFGAERLLEVLYSNRENSAKELKESIKEAFFHHHGHKRGDNDITCLIFDVEEHLLPNGEEVICATFSPDLSQLDAVRGFIERTCDLVPGNTCDFTDQMQLAINEIFCNIVEHGFKDEPSGEIVITATLEETGIRIDIADQSSQFEPSAIAEPNLAGDLYRGFGWYIIRSIVDEIRYVQKQTDEGWNHLELYKLYPKQETIMEIDHKVEDDIMIITPKVNALDAKDVPEFKEMMLNIIQNENHTGVRKFILNLDQVDFVDSSGLGSFLSVLRHLRDHGSALRIANMKKSVRTIFELVSMHKVFEIHETVEAAKQSFTP